MSKIAHLAAAVLLAAGAGMAPAAAQDAGTAFGPTGPRDTLWGIGARLRAEGATVEQTMLALTRLNPDAFVGPQGNLVKAGAMLRVPTLAEARAVSADEARRMVADPSLDWSAPLEMAETGDGQGIARLPAIAGPAAADGPPAATVPPPARRPPAAALPQPEAVDSSAWQHRAQDAEQRVAELTRERDALQARLAEQVAVAAEAQRRLSALQAEVARAGATGGVERTGAPRSVEALPSAAPQRRSPRTSEPVPEMSRETPPPSPFAKRDEPSSFGLWYGVGALGVGALVAGFLWRRRRATGKGGPQRGSGPRPMGARAVAAMGATSDQGGPDAEAPEHQPSPADDAEASADASQTVSAAAEAPAAPSAPASQMGDESAALDAEDDAELEAPADYSAATKLNLARAYANLDDRDNAREVCLEVMQEGDDAEREAAKALLERLDAKAG